MRRGVSLAVLTVVVVSSMAGAAITVSAAQTHVAVESVDTSVDQPAPGETFTLTTNVSNLASSSGTVEVTDVYVRKADSSTEYARIENVGTVASGGTLSVPLTMRFDDAGEKRLTVYAVVRDSDGGVSTAKYPLYVDVEEPDEAVLSFADLDPVAGQESSVNVTVSNGDAKPVSNVRLELGGDADVENPERVNASVKSGTSTTYTYRVTFPESGDRTLDATLTYKTAQGSTRTITRQVTTNVEEANLDADLTATTKAVNGSSVVQASLAEYGNLDLRDVQIRAVVDGSVVARTMAPDVLAEESQTVTFDGSAVPAGEVTIVARYTAGGEARTTRTTIQYSPQETANVSLTGVEVASQGSTLTLSGEAANLGSADASSVLVSVAGGDGVSPSASNGEYFVGSIETSEFSTFELTATTDGASVQSVPVRISYSVDGERISEVVDVAVGSAAAASGGAGGADGAGSGGTPSGPGGAGGPPGGSGGLPLTEIGLVLALLVVAGVGVAAYRWRQR